MFRDTKINSDKSVLYTCINFTLSFSLSLSLSLSLPLSRPSIPSRRTSLIVHIPISHIEVYKIYIYGVSILQRPPQNGRSVYIRASLFYFKCIYILCISNYYVKLGDRSYDRENSPVATSACNVRAIVVEG